MAITQVVTALITDLAVTTAKIAAGAVTGAKLAMGSDAQGDVLYHNGTDYVRLGAGTSGKFLETKGAAANPQWTTVPSRPPDFTSSELTVTADTLITQAHSLGAFPSLVKVTFKCDDASGDLGYADDEELAAETMMQTAGDESCQVSWDGTNVYIVQGVTFNCLNKSTFNIDAATVGKWKWVIRAWV
jgi:hypothetical protein